MKREKKAQTNQAKTVERKAWRAPKHHEIKMRGVMFDPLDEQDLLNASGGL